MSENLILKFIDSIFSNNNLAQLNEDEILFLWYEKIKLLKDFAFISGYELYKFLIDNFEFDGSVLYNEWGSAYLYIENKEVLKKLENIFKKDDKKVKSIADRFKKSGIRGITYFGNNFENKPLIFFKSDYSIDDEFVYFDTNRIREKILITKYDLEKAYCYYCLEEHIQAFDTLEVASLEYFKKRKFTLYFISEFNKKNLYPFISKRDRNVGSLFDLYEKLPKSTKSRVKFLLDFEHYIEKQYNKSTDFLEDLKSSNNRLDYSVANLYNFVLDLLYQVNLNFLIVDDYLKDVYKNIFKSIAYAYKYKKIKYVDFVFVLVAIKGFSNWKELQKFVKGVDIELKLNNENNILMGNYQKIYNNLENAYLTKDIKSKYVRCFKTYITLLTYSNLSQQDINAIANAFVDVFNKKALMLDDYEMIDMFISQYSEKIHTELLHQLLESFLNKFICSKFNFYDLNSFNYPFFGQIFLVLKNNNIKISDEKLNSFLDFVKTINDTEIKFKIYGYFLVGLYTLSDYEGIKTELINFKKELLQSDVENIESNTYDIPTIEIDKKYRYYEYVLILYFYDVYKELEQDLKDLKNYLKQMKGFCSCLYQLLHLLQIIRSKKKIINEIIAMIEDKIQEYNKIRDINV